MPAIADDVPPLGVPATCEEVRARVEELLPGLRARAATTEKMRRLHPVNLEELTKSGVFRLTMPRDVGGYEADDYTVTEVLAQIARSCPSTGFVCTIILSLNCLPAMLGDSAADEIYATQALRISGTITPTGKALPVSGGYKITGEWAWLTGGVHSNWIATACTTTDKDRPDSILALIPATSVTHHDTWFAAGMAGTATGTVSVKDVFVPRSRTLPVSDFTGGVFPPRRYSSNPYFNRPWVMWANILGGSCLLGIARGAMQAFVEILTKRGPITHTRWTKAAESPWLHHQLAKAQFELDIAEMFMGRMRLMLGHSWGRDATVAERIKARASLGQIATHARACVNLLFEASGASQVLLTSEIQRYFRDMNIIHQHAAIQPNSSDELYGRILAGQAPDTDFF